MEAKNRLDNKRTNQPEKSKHISRISHGDVSNKIEKFHKKTEALSQPTPQWVVNPTDPLYAQPITGGRKVRHHNYNHDANDAVEEVKYLCNFIKQYGEKNSVDGTIEITFGKLFELYVNISSKLVGTLIRARKYQFLAFKGELLLQHRDENVIITLLNQQD